MRLILITLILLISSYAYGLGPYSHMYVADMSFNVAKEDISNKFPNLTAKEIDELLSYYNAGSHAPDFGYFPNGELQFSMLAHYLRSGDLLVTLFKLSQTPEEYAFALGWKTHLDADEFAHIHSVNKAAAEMLGIENEYPRGVTYEFDPLVHNKVEMGGDVRRLMAYPELRKKRFPLKVPLDPRYSNNRNFIEEAYIRVYAFKISRRSLLGLSQSITEDVHFIPEIFKARGNLPPLDKGLEGAISGLQSLAMMPLFTIFMSSKSLGSRALLNPYKMDDKQWHRHEKATKTAIYHVKKRLKDDFTRIPNRNLDRGGPIFVHKYDPSGSLLLEIEKQHPEKIWAEEYPPEVANKLASDWKRLLRQYDRHTN